MPGVGCWDVEVVDCFYGVVDGGVVLGADGFAWVGGGDGDDKVGILIVSATQGGRAA